MHTMHAPSRGVEHSKPLATYSPLPSAGGLVGVVCMWASIPLRQRTWGTDGGVPNAGYGPHIETPVPAGSHVFVECVSDRLAPCARA